ncbi:hypothetical protein L226DRAFT_141788 [Lentinus tigrinus ALCF2SS1-7]|uniref:Uncharacterized protein n=1 Tax=Lentinus tigrinus ALCF2SS1-6 TaxID=1328759 RepID=A0A5C2S423_9APHY|nr:hypothetical protein L227DRAFT_192025 [Lentinus tigrinus ALCF2SS1-6]RPD72943.1 hypothetical protein L226DRAFT_141788 [Lentinus tigrinus ALCF2SS1-7]
MLRALTINTYSGTRRTRCRVSTDVAGPQLDRDQSLQGWLAGHNGSLDVLGGDEQWPSPVARIAALLISSDSRVTDEPRGPWAEDFADMICSCTRPVRRSRHPERFPWESMFAMVMEEVLPEVVTYFHCEYVKPRPDNTYETHHERLDCGSSCRGTASLLVLLPANAPAPTHEEHDAVYEGDECKQPSHKGNIPHQECTKESAEVPPAATISEFEIASHRSLDLGSSHSGSSSDATLYEVEEVASGSELSIEVEIEDVDEDPYWAMSEQLPNLNAAKLAAHTTAVLVPLTTTGPASIATEYTDAHYSHSSCSTSASPSSSSTTSQVSFPPPRLSQDGGFPGRLYDALPSHILQQHIFPSPFYPTPLVPLLCVADERNIAPLMCSALYQRRALSLDAPVVGVLLPRSGLPQCEILFGWIEDKQRVGYALPRAHIVARDLVFDLRSPQAMSRIIAFLVRLGPCFSQSISRRRMGFSSGLERSLVWRADSQFRRRSGVEERIKLWAHEVQCCNGSEEDDEDASSTFPSRSESDAGLDELRQLMKILHLSSPCSNIVKGMSQQPSLTVLSSSSNSLEETTEPESPTMQNEAMSGVDDSSIWQRVCASVGAWCSGREVSVVNGRTSIASTSSSTCVNSGTSA